MPNSDADTAAAANRVRQQVEDALELSRFVIETGVTDGDGQPLPFADIQTIQNTAVTLGVIQINGSTAPQKFEKTDWVDFEQAYYRLAIATHPVTAETLRNTRYVAGAAGAAAAKEMFSLDGLRARIIGYSPAQRFTRMLWAVTILVAAFALCTEWQLNVLGAEKNAELVQVKKELWTAVQPWAYGALGACAYLLRSGHYYIYARSFDLRRTPEYYNRILLGALSGGAIILFVNYLVSQDDSLSHIGTTAFGFIAGYSTDFLFNTIERIVTAILPKVEVQTVQRDEDKPKKPVRRPAGNGGAARGGAGAAGAGAGAAGGGGGGG